MNVRTSLTLRDVLHSPMCDLFLFYLTHTPPVRSHERSRIRKRQWTPTTSLQRRKRVSVYLDSVLSRRHSLYTTSKPLSHSHPSLCLSLSVTRLSVSPSTAELSVHTCVDLSSTVDAAHHPDKLTPPRPPVVAVSCLTHFDSLCPIFVVLRFFPLVFFGATPPLT